MQGSGPGGLTLDITVLGEDPRKLNDQRDFNAATG